MSKKMIISLLVLSFALYCVILYQVADFTPAPLSDAATDRPVVYADDRAERVEGRAAIVSPWAPTGEAAQSDSGDVAGPLAAEEAAKNAAIARAEAQLDDRQHSARQRTAQLVTADLERGRREEADRIVVELDKTLQSGDDVTSVIAKQRNTDGRVKSAKSAKASEEVEDLLHASRGRAAQQITTALRENSNARAVGLSQAVDDVVLHVSRVEPSSQATSITSSPKQLRSDRLDQKAAQFGTSGAESQKKRSGPLESGANSQKSLHGSRGELRIESQSRALSSSVSSIASLNGLEGKLQRRCPSILASSSEYDDDLVSLCQTWVAGR